MIEVYYKLVQIPEPYKSENGIRSKARLDCTVFSDLVEGGYNGLTNFVNSKGQLILYKTKASNFVSADRKRLAEWSLTNNQNLSSIYIEDLDYPEIGYGYPNPNRSLSNGDINPMYEFCNDGYLFLLNRDYTQIELLVIPEGRNLISSYYQMLIDGAFTDQINSLRDQAKPFYQYKGIAL